MALYWVIHGLEKASNNLHITSSVVTGDPFINFGPLFFVMICIFSYNLVSYLFCIWIKLDQFLNIYM